MALRSVKVSASHFKDRPLLPTNESGAAQTGWVAGCRSPRPIPGGAPSQVLGRPSLPVRAVRASPRAVCLRSRGCRLLAGRRHGRAVVPGVEQGFRVSRRWAGRRSAAWAGRARFRVDGVVCGAVLPARGAGEPADRWMKHSGTLGRRRLEHEVPRSEDRGQLVVVLDPELVELELECEPVPHEPGAALLRH